MANRYFNNQFQYSFEQMPVSLFLKASIGASGAVTLDAANSKGIASITKETAAGQYTIVLQDSYKKLLCIHEQQLLAAGTAAAPIMVVISESVATSAKSIVVQHNAVDGTTAANMASGTVIRMRLDLGNK